MGQQANQVVDDAVQALRESESHFRQLAEAIPVQVWTAKPNGELDFVTERCATYFGRTPDEVIGSGWQGVVHPEDLPGVAVRWAHSLETGEIYEVEFRLLRAEDDSFRWHLGRAVALRSAEGEIERWFGTNTDIDGQKQAELERDRARADADAAREAAQAANEAKTRFLHVISHELRTPLGAIAGYVDLMRDGIHGPITDGQARCFDRISYNQRHLLHLVNDLLDLAKMEAGELTLRPQTFSIRTLLEGVRMGIEPLVERKNQIFEVLAEADAELRADPDRTEQVLLNLLSNAVKFTPTEGKITLSSERGPDRVRIRVSDSGIGIPEAKLETVFQPFVQVESTPSTESGGTGLGLAISRELVRRMGGDLTVESVPGIGSTFTVELPLGG